MSKSPAVRVLIVDDEVDHADVMAEAVARMGFAVVQAHSLSEGKKRLSDEAIELVITDLRMDQPDDGMELLRYVKRNHPTTEVLVVTAYGDVSTAVQCMREGAYDFIQKPLDLEIIRQQVRRAAEKVQLTQQNIELNQALDHRFGMTAIIGASEPMQRVARLIRQIAPTEINVLILGESGTGKELVARALHQNSRRSGQRFVALNCAGLNESTLEDELFGHVRGAFTDARADRIGRFEYADGGTLFLDEIGDMPLTMQAKLLRVLQDRQITRLGSNEPIQTNVRFVAATNRDLESAVQNKSFREDLYFRIKGATIQLPPLRQRREDILLLVRFFVEKFARQNNKVITGIAPAAREVLTAFPWPGNVRQLENAIESIVILAAGPEITLADIPSEITQNVNVTTALATIPDRGEESTALAPMTGMNLADLERKAIEHTLAMVAGNREQAAKILGIGERTLYRKIKEYGLIE
jgi:DNA-binding NtrC family response regulator